MAKRSKPTIGWREWCDLPDLGVNAVKAKVDTGARTSSLHAFAVEEVDRDGEPWVRFEVHPVQRSRERAAVVEAPLVEHRSVRPSTGAPELRPVIRTTLSLREHAWPIEITLTDRDVMGFRMLLGRHAVRQRFVVDPGRSYVQSDRPDRLAERKGRGQV
jgi:hypothetical protein